MFSIEEGQSIICLDYERNLIGNLMNPVFDFPVICLVLWSHKVNFSKISDQT